MIRVFLNQIATAVPPNDIHQAFVGHAPNLLSDEKDKKKFRILTRRAQIEHRYSVLRPAPTTARFDADDFYLPADFPSTKQRMALYKQTAFPLARQALDQLDMDDRREKITHVVITSCTGFYAPGIDQDIIRHYGLQPSVERTIVGFMGCQAAVNAMKIAYHIVRSQPAAQVLIVNIELCTLHMQDADDIDQVMSFLIFADGCAASVVSAEPTGLEILGFHSGIMPESKEFITWHIGDTGFDMMLAREVPVTIATGIEEFLHSMPGAHSKDEITCWAVHPGGRAILDAVQEGLQLAPGQLAASRGILRDYGNMSSATLMFVLNETLRAQAEAGLGCALAFGPGLTAEMMLFQKASA